MRLPEDKIQEAILHPDLDVRDTAIRYFYSSTPDPTLMPLAIQAIEHYGQTGAFSFTHYLNRLPQTEQTIAWVMAELKRDLQEPPEELHFYYLNLSRLLSHADSRLVAQQAPEILQAPHFDPNERQGFRERLEMFGWNAEKCWQELRQYCETCKEKNNLEEFDLGHALRIVEALARQPQEYQEQIVALLSEQVHDLRHNALRWLQPLLANLAGEMGLQAAIPLLVGNLGLPYSFLSDQSLFALAKIGSNDVVSAVCEQFPRASRDFRLYASELLGMIHLELTVERVLELLPGETDFRIRMNLCEALLDHFSFEGIEAARQLIKEHELSPDLRGLRLQLIAICKIMGTRFPEFDGWQEEARRDAQEERAQMRQIQKLAFEAGGDLGLLVRKLQAQVAEKQAENRNLRAQVAEKERLLASKPSPRPMQGLAPGRETRADSVSARKPNRIGRNDPCPCGSGKKFKNCCMKR
jgi:SEC-C motif